MHLTETKTALTLAFMPLSLLHGTSFVFFIDLITI